jgi:hypothetical protein
MKSNKLRTRNYVTLCGVDYNNGHKFRDKEGDKIVKIYGVNEEGLQIILKDTIYFVNFSEVEPIPLTEEWLLKFGFRTEEPYFFELDNISITTKRELMWIFTKYKNNVELELPEHVHQLQNLYLELTNNELEIL